MSNILSNSISMQKNTEINDNKFDSYTLVLKILSKIEDKDKLLIINDKKMLSNRSNPIVCSVIWHFVK